MRQGESRPTPVIPSGEARSGWDRIVRSTPNLSPHARRDRATAFTALGWRREARAERRSQIRRSHNRQNPRAAGRAIWQSLSLLAVDEKPQKRESGRQWP